MSSAAALVQLVRNFLCCLKDLRLFRGTAGTAWLWDSAVTGRYYDLPRPLDRTTPLEAAISLSQAYVVLTGVPAAGRLFGASLGKLHRAYRLMAAAATGRGGAPVATDAERLIHASLVREAFLALRSTFVAFNLFFISLAFVWLSANSWHITEAGWIGGLPALMHALTVMNICLVPLLYYMYRDAGEQFAKAARMQLLAEKLQQGSATEADLGLTALEALAGWLPFWSSGVRLFESVDADTEEKLLAAEKTKVQGILDEITGATAAKKKADTEPDETTVRTRIQREKADELQPIIAVARLEGYREYLYFVLNAIALYGYSLCVVVYYWPDELKQPDWLRIAMLHLSNDDADWHGNFAGDLMWTIEPIVVLASPLYLSAVKRRKPLKSKTD